MSRVVYGPEDVKPFVESHGGNPAKLKGRWLLSDGATLHLGEWGVSFAEPPDDPRELLGLRREYHLCKLGKTQRDFQLLKAALLGFGEPFRWDESEYGKPPSETLPHTGAPDPRPALKHLQTLVLKHRSELEAIDADIASMEDTKKEAARRRLNERLDSEAEHRAEALQAEITAITI